MSGNDASTLKEHAPADRQNQRFHLFYLPYTHISSVFGNDWFALKAETFARFFGTPVFLIAQTAIVAIWILINVIGVWGFDKYPFILLNLAFSLQAAYAAPLILLAQTRQADRDKFMALADAQHREDLHKISDERQRVVAEQTELLIRLLEKNTQLTETSRKMASHIETLTVELHNHILKSKGRIP